MIKDFEKIELKELSSLINITPKFKDITLKCKCELLEIEIRAQEEGVFESASLKRSEIAKTLEIILEEYPETIKDRICICAYNSSGDFKNVPAYPITVMDIDTFIKDFYKYYIKLEKTYLFAINGKFIDVKDLKNLKLEAILCSSVSLKQINNLLLEEER